MGPKRLQYTDDDVKAACQAVRKGSSLRAAAKKHGVPTTTLSDRLKGKASIREKPRTMLPPEEEEKVVEWLKEAARRGFKKSKSEIISTVETIVTNANLPTCFKGNRPGRKWYESFMRRHKNELSGKTPQGRGSQSAGATEKKLSRFHQARIETDAVNKQVLTDPSQIFNCDESREGLSMSLEAISDTEEEQTDRHRNDSLITLNMTQKLTSRMLPSTSSLNALSALDRLLDLTAKAGCHKLIEYRTAHDMQQLSDEPEERHFCSLYRQLRQTLQQDRKSHTEDRSKLSHKNTKSVVIEPPKMVSSSEFKQYKENLLKKKKDQAETKERNKKEMEKKRKRVQEEKERKQKERKENKKERDAKKMEKQRVEGKRRKPQTQTNRKRQKTDEDSHNSHTDIIDNDMTCLTTADGIDNSRQWSPCPGQ